MNLLESGREISKKLGKRKDGLSSWLFCPFEVIVQARGRLKQVNMIVQKSIVGWNISLN